MPRDNQQQTCSRYAAQVGPHGVLPNGCPQPDMTAAENRTTRKTHTPGSRCVFDQVLSGKKVGCGGEFGPPTFGLRLPPPPNPKSAGSRFVSDAGPTVFVNYSHGHRDGRRHGHSRTCAGGNSRSRQTEQHRSARLSFSARHRAGNGAVHPLEVPKVYHRATMQQWRYAESCGVIRRLSHMFDCGMPRGCSSGD